MAEGYGEARERVLERLGLPLDPAGSSSANGFFSAERETGAQLCAIPFASIIEAALLVDVQRADHRSERPANPAIRHAVIDARCDFYDFGVGVLTLTYEITAEHDIDFDSFCLWSAEFRAHAAVANRGPVASLGGRFRDAMDGDLIQPLFEPWARLLPTDQPPCEAAEDAGHLLWIHTVYEGIVPSGWEPAQYFALALDLIPSHGAAVEVPGALICPGNLVSLAFHDGGRAVRENAHCLRRVMASMNAWWNAAWELDRFLFGFLNEFSVGTRLVVSGDLTLQAQRITALHEHVRLFRILLDTHLFNRSGRDRRMWDAAAGVWWLAENLTAVDAKIDALTEVHESITVELESRRTKRLNLMVALFTVVAVPASSAQIAVYLAPNSLSGAARAAVSIAMLALAVIALSVALRTRPYARAGGASAAALAVGQRSRRGGTR